MEPNDGNVLICNCSGGSITNLTLSKADSEERYAIRIASGSITIQRCNIASNGLSCIGIESACPKILHNDIHGSPQPGIMIFSGGIEYLRKCDEIFRWMPID